MGQVNLVDVVTPTMRKLLEHINLPGMAVLTSFMYFLRDARQDADRDVFRVAYFAAIGTDEGRCGGGD